ncbi:MAG: hypothetical protein ABL886_05710 [Rhodoglobus sp.]
MSDRSGTKAMVTIVALISGGMGIQSVVSRSVGIGYLLALVVFALGASMLATLIPSAPGWLRAIGSTFTQRWKTTSVLMTIVVLSTASGLRARTERVASCRRAIAEAQEAGRRHQPAMKVRSAFESAIRACRNTDLATEQEVATAGVAAAQRDIDAEREAAFAGHLGDARRLAEQPGNASASIASFEQARKLGPLAPADAALLARQLVAKATALAADGAHGEALGVLQAAERADASLPELRGLIDGQAALVRTAAIEAAIAEAQRVQRSKLSCDKPLEVKQAWDQLRTIHRGEPRFAQAAKAAAGLESCRKQMIKTLASGMRSLAGELRAQAAHEYENSLLNEGLDVRVRVSGAARDRMTITYVLFNRAWAYKITDGGSMSEGAFLRKMQDGGFRRVTFSDGYYDSTYYDLKPEPMEQVAARSIDLSSPLKLE